MENLRRVQLAQADILKNVAELCEREGITYFAAYGTLLGAVRHKGFIPWDDDIDITMPRPDYERFCAIAPKKLKHPYFLQCNKTEPAYVMHFAKIHNVDTTYIEPDYENRRVTSGIFIDVFPMDGAWKMGKFGRELWRLTNKMYKYCAIDYLDWHSYYPNRNINRKIGNIINSCFYGNKSPQYFFDKQEELCQKVSYRDSEYVTDYGDPKLFKRKWFDKKTYLDFEDMKISCPADYDAVLRVCYGDYMKLPPVEERNPHHGITIADIEKPYTYYINSTSEK